MSLVNQALVVALATGVPFCLVGDSGVGKSKRVEALGEKLGRPIWTLIGSRLEPSDFSGMPYLSNGQVSFAPPPWGRFLQEHPTAILFVDELTSCPPTIQAPLLSLIHDRRAGDLQLPSTIGILAAMNPVDRAAGGWPLAPPTANRFAFWDCDPDVDEFLDYLRAGEWEQPSLHLLPPSWEERLPETRMFFGEFLTRNRSLIHAFPVDRQQRGLAWPSRRSWSNALRLYGACTAIEDEPLRVALQQHFLAGCVGQGAATEFWAWREQQDLPDPQVILDDPSQLTLPTQSARSYVILSSVIGWLLGSPERMTPQRWENAWRVLAKAAEAGNTDVAAEPATRLYATPRPPGTTAPREVLVFEGVLRSAHRSL